MAELQGRPFAFIRHFALTASTINAPVHFVPFLVMSRPPTSLLGLLRGRNDFGGICGRDFPNGAGELGQLPIPHYIPWRGQIQGSAMNLCRLIGWGGSNFSIFIGWETAPFQWRRSVAWVSLWCGLCMTSGHSPEQSITLRWINPFPMGWMVGDMQRATQRPIAHHLKLVVT